MQGGQLASLGQGTWSGHTHGFNLRAEDMTLCNIHQTQDLISRCGQLKDRCALGEGARNGEAKCWVGGISGIIL